MLDDHKALIQSISTLVLPLCAHSMYSAGVHVVTVITTVELHIQCTPLTLQNHSHHFDAYCASKSDVRFGFLAC